MHYDTPTNEWNGEARRAAETMAAFRNRTTAKDTDGYMVVIADQMGKSEAVFVGWAPEDMVGNLLELIQFGSPYHLGVLTWLPATVEEVENYQNALKLFRCRTDDSNWVRFAPEVKDYIQRIRSSVKASTAKATKALNRPVIEATGTKSTALKRDAAQQRRRNKRAPNRRRH